MPTAPSARARRLALTAHATQVELLDGGFALSNRIAQPLPDTEYFKLLHGVDVPRQADGSPADGRVRGAGVTAADEPQSVAAGRGPRPGRCRSGTVPDQPVDGRREPGRGELVDWILVALITLLTAWTAVLGIAFLPLYLGPVPLPVSALLGVGAMILGAAGLLPLDRLDAGRAGAGCVLVWGVGRGWC